ncbi:MAG: thioredoxin family protein [Acidimicrobiia bacterium]
MRLPSGDRVTIEVRYFDSCPNWKRTRRLIEGITGEAPRLLLVETLQQAEELDFAGSPTVLVNGVDPWSDQAAAASMSCRIYRTPDGSLVGGPTEAMLRDALKPDA